MSGERCVYCRRRRPVAGSARCAPCQQDQADRLRARHAAAAGRPAPDSAPPSGRPWEAARRAAGLCTSCGRRPAGSERHRAHCEECAEKWHAVRVERRERRRAEGRCGECGWAVCRCRRRVRPHSSRSAAWRTWKNRRRTLRRQIAAGRITEAEHERLWLEARDRYRAGAASEAMRRREAARSWLAANDPPGPAECGHGGIESAAECVSAQGHVCKCSCGGANHGVMSGMDPESVRWVAKRRRAGAG